LPLRVGGSAGAARPGLCVPDSPVTHASAPVIPAVLFLCSGLELDGFHWNASSHTGLAEIRHNERSAIAASLSVILSASTVPPFPASA
jgi:hypothetical protein